MTVEEYFGDWVKVINTQQADSILKKVISSKKLCPKPINIFKAFKYCSFNNLKVVIIGDTPAIGELCEAYSKYGKSVVGIKEVSDEFVVKYCSLKAESIGDREFSVTDMIEKPKPHEVFSNFSILGRCVLPPEIFEILKATPPGAGGEIQLTDAMKVLAVRDGMVGVDFVGTRYDMGNKFGILKANIDFQFEVAKRKYTTLLNKELERKEIQEGLIKACNVIDLIIEILRGSKDRATRHPIQ